MDDYVHFLGFVADADLPVLYSAALVTALPSLYEGFGIPVLESMACGTPVLTSNISSFDALERLLSNDDLRAQLAEAGRARAALFTWDKAADLLLQVYRQWI